MILIADSGSTKTDWISIDGSQRVKYETVGLNPFYLSTDDMTKVLRANRELIGITADVEQVYFYGAGCSSDEKNAIVISALRDVFECASVWVRHDYLASAYATYSGAPGISCILGTGSNSCFFDGENATEMIPSLGYILGDEGSGSHLGKKLLRLYLYDMLPSYIRDNFDNDYNLSKDELISNILTKPKANTYLASFAMFFSKYRKDYFLNRMLRDSLTEFMKIHIQCYENYRDVPVHFVGSIAFVFDKELQDVAGRLGITIGNVIKQPIDGLAEYHSKNIT